MDPEIEQEVHAILRRLGEPVSPLEFTDGFANLVVTTPSAVIRLNEGRFPDAFRHEANVLAHLPSTIPHPAVIGLGRRDGGGEYLVLERVPGQSLEQAWPRLSTAQRLAIGKEIGVIVQTLHQLTPAPWMVNPWVSRALAEGRWRDAYHAPASAYPALLASARAARPDLDDLFDTVEDWFAERADIMSGPTSIFLHTDLHGRNVIVHDGKVTALIDFEGSRLGPPSVELDMLFRWLTDSNGEPQRVEFLQGMSATYPELFAQPHLVEQLDVSEALWHLVQLHHWQPGAQWMSDPAEGLSRVIRGEHADHVQRLLDMA
jgi:aminoglycoside phosphotransferase (APT) family kinase protein